MTLHTLPTPGQPPCQVTRLPTLWSITFLDANNSYGICTVVAETVEIARVLFGLKNPDYVEILSEQKL